MGRRHILTDIDSCKVFVENGEVKTVLSEEIRRDGDVDVDVETSSDFFR